MPLRCTVSDPRVCRPCFYPRQGLPRGTPETLPPCGGLAVNPWPEGRHSPPEGGSWGLKQFESLRRPQRGVASVSTPNTDAENTLAYGTGDKPRRIKDAACFLSRCRPIEPLQANMRRPCFFPFPGRALATQTVALISYGARFLCLEGSLRFRNIWVATQATTKPHIHFAGVARRSVSTPADAIRVHGAGAHTDVALRALWQRADSCLAGAVADAARLHHASFLPKRAGHAPTLSSSILRFSSFLPKRTLM